VIKDLDETITAMLKDGLPDDFANQIQISFAAPDDQFPPKGVTLPALDLFLYDVRENLELRSSEFYIERNPDGTATKTWAPARVDFSYLITAWPSESVRDPAEDEHRLLGEVMRVLLRHRTLPRTALHGLLVSQDLPPPVSSLQPGRLQSVGEFWQALGGKPKAALNYTVTLAVDVAPPEKVSIVTDKEIRLRLEVGSR
jgi:hypothetical protein